MKYLHEYFVAALPTGRYCVAPDPLPDSCFIIYEPLIVVNGITKYRYLPRDKRGETLVTFEEMIK